MSDNILIITGGTGGHVLPAVNFFKYLENNNQKVFILTDKRGSKYINDINIEDPFVIFNKFYNKITAKDILKISQQIFTSKNLVVTITYKNKISENYFNNLVNI